MTTEELARIIGVSRTTLSKVINGQDGVSDETRRRVQEYIRRYNYVPNVQARSLVGKKEPIIGFFSTYVESADDQEEVSSHFATELVNLVVHAAQKRGYKTLVDITYEENDFSEIEQYINSGLLQGAILFGYASGNPALKHIASKGIPLTLINQENATPYDKVSLINMNDEIWGFRVIERMVQLGHRNILFLNSSRNRLPMHRREHGVRRAIDKYADCVDSFEMRYGEFSTELSAHIVTEIFTGSGPKPTAIFAANDQMAIGAMNALKKLNYQIPQQVSVVGFDDIFISRYLSPALTTVHCDFRQIARQSVNALINCIENKSSGVCVEQELAFMDRETLDRAPERKDG